MSEERRKAGNPGWTVGRSGNPTGKSKTKILTDQLKALLVQDPKRVRNIADKVIELAEGGDLEATKLIFERLEGRVSQTIDVNTTVTNLTPEERRQRVIELQSRLINPEADDAEEVPDARH
jgi:ribosomal protein L17